MQQETGDVWDTDINFAAGLKNAPAKEDIKPGKVFTGIKAKEAVAAFNVKEGEQFEGLSALCRQPEKAARISSKTKPACA